MKAAGTQITCSLCRRSVSPNMITQHHLVPKQKGGKVEHTVPMCRPCHKQVHAVFGNTELARVFNSIELLRAAPQLGPFFKWIRKQKSERNFRTVQSNDHPDRRKRKKF